MKTAGISTAAIASLVSLLPGVAQAQAVQPVMQGVVLPSLDPAAVDDAVRSATGTTPASIAFTNRSGGPVDIYWINFTGERVLYRTGLAVGATWAIRTFLTHPWLVVASGSGGTTARDSGSRIAAFEALTPNGDTAIIRGAVLQKEGLDSDSVLTAPQGTPRADTAPVPAADPRHDGENGSQAPSITQFADRAAWENASTDLKSVGFAGLGGSAGDPRNSDKSYPSGITIDGVRFTAGNSRYLFVRAAAPAFLFGPADSHLGCPPPQSAPCGTPGAGITVELPPGATSVGLDLGSFWPPRMMSLHFSNGQTFDVPNGFTGFVSSIPLNSIAIHAAGLPIVRSVTFGTASRTAQPLTLDRPTPHPDPGPAPAAVEAQAGHSATGPVPGVSDLSIQQARARVREMEKEISDALASMPVLPLKEQFESTAVYNKRNQVWFDMEKQRVTPIRSRLEQFKNELYLDNSLRPTFLGYDADAEVLTAGVLPGVSCEFRIPRTPAKSMRDSWSDVSVARNLTDDVVSTAAELRANKHEASEPAVALVSAGQVYVGYGGSSQGPSVTFKVNPEYSEEARRIKYSGTVTLAIVVGADGRLGDIRVVKGLGYGLDDKAVEAVRQWRFRPGYRNCVPASIRATVEINFRM